MPIIRLGRDPESLDALRLYGALPSRANSYASLHDPVRLDEFLARIRASISASLENPSRLRGVNAELMFRAVVVAIGTVGLITDEDAGDVYYDKAAGTVKPPDYRVVDCEGQHMLIEVKSVPPARATRTFAMRDADVAAHRRYAGLTGAELFFALYWPGWNTWTLVPEAALRHNNAKREIDLPGAIVADHMYRLGDARIGTTPPLILSTEVEATEKPISPGTVSGVITSATMSAAGTTLDDPLESNIAWTLMIYGSWSVEEEHTLRADGSGWRTDFVARPPTEEAQEDAERQGMMGVGTLSSLYSSMFHEATLTVDGRVKQLDDPPVPGIIGALIPPNYWENDRRFSLWRLEVRPSD